MEREPAKPGAAAVGSPDAAVGVLYQARVQIWAHTEQVRWALFYNYLVANSILLLGWAAVFASGPKFDHATWVLLVFIAAGVALSLVWSALGFRSSAFAKTQEGLVRDFERDVGEALGGNREAPFASAQALRERMGGPMRWMTSKQVVGFVPLGFAVVYLALLVPTVGVLLGPAAGPPSPAPPLTSTLVPTTIP